MSTESLEEEITAALPDIDAWLAASGIAIQQRPMNAAIEFVNLFVREVRVGGERTVPGTFDTYATTDWFARIFQWIVRWYHERYGESFARREDATLDGVIAIANTAFLLKVPRNVSRPAETPGETWFGIPDDVLADEDPLDWISNPPVLAHLSEQLREQALADARHVAGKLRFTHCALTGVAVDDASFDGLRSRILPHLARAAQLLVGGTDDEVQLTFWELQMACEAALKAVQQQRTASFKTTHDLFVLHDLLSPPPPLSRELLKALPRWDEMAELRYGQGPKRSRAFAMQSYRAALEIVAGAIACLERIPLGKARFKLAPPPWTRTLPR